MGNRFRGGCDLPPVSEIRNGRNRNSGLADQDSVLNPAKLPHTPTPAWKGCTGGHAFPLSQVLDLPHSPDVADALVRLPQPKRCTVIARDGISETPWEVLNDQSENRNQAPLETCTRATQSPFR